MEDNQQDLIERLRRTQMGESSALTPERQEGLIDLNLLPARYRRRGPRWREILPWVLFLLLAGLVVPHTQRYVETTDSYRAVEGELIQAQGELQAFQPLIDELTSLREDIQGVDTQISRIRDAYGEVQLDATRWSIPLQSMIRLAPEGVELISVVQEGERVIINGLSTAYDDPLAYSRALERIGGFPAVVVNSILRLPEETLTSQEGESVGEITEGEEEGGEQASTAGGEERVMLYQFEITVWNSLVLGDG